MSNELEDGSEVLLLKSVWVFWAKVPVENEKLNKTVSFFEGMVVDWEAVLKRVWAKKFESEYFIHTDV